MIPFGFQSRIHCTVREGGWISQYTCASRTRRAISCVNWDPKSTIRMGDPRTVGRDVQFNGVRCTIVGILPPDFAWPDYEADVWAPLDLTPVLADANRARKFHFLGAFGRVRPGVAIDAVSGDLRRVTMQLEREHPESNTGILAHPVPVRDAIVGDVRPALLVLMAAAALVLLIACANVAGILLSRTIARRQELAIRAALGAGRGRLARQLLAESLMLAALGGGLAIPLAYWGTDALVAVAGNALPRLGPVRVDGGVLLFAVTATLASGVLFGVVPAVVGTRTALHDALREDGRGSTGGAVRLRLRRTLVTGQMALAVMLMVGAGLLVKSLMHLRRVELGFDASRLITFEVVLAGPKYDTPEKQDAFYAALLPRLRALPGALSAAAGGSIPLAGGSSASLAIRGRDVPEGQLPEVGYTPVSDDYFRTLRIPLLRGRAFDERERNGGPGAVVLSESAARKHWGAGDPVGAQVRLGPDPSEPWNTVVGVVGDVRQDGVAAEPRPTVYVSQRQDHWGGGRIIVRAAGDPTTLIGAIRREVRRVDPALPLAVVRTMDEMVAGDLATTRLPMLLMSAFAALALLLAAIGVYGVMAYAVAARTREFGIRMALGGLPSSVLGLVLRDGVVVSLTGTILGVAAAAAASGLLRRLLYGVEPLDAPTFAAAALALAAVMLGACYVPARRATRVDPMVALRAD
jgi:putative ABC transport system permease protein